MKIVVKRMVVGPVCTNCYIVRRSESNKAVIVDPGEDFQKIKGYIENDKLEPIGILLTHGHFDHIGAADELKRQYGIKIYAYEDEKDIVNSDLNLGGMFGCPAGCDVDFFVKEGEKIVLDEMEFEVIHTPGHTKGSCCFLLRNEKLLFSGDTLFMESVGRTDLPTGSMSTLVRSIKEKLFVLPNETKVYPGHGDSTTIGHEKKYNPFI